MMSNGLHTILRWALWAFGIFVIGWLLAGLMQMKASAYRTEGSFIVVIGMAIVGFGAIWLAESRILKQALDLGREASLNAAAAALKASRSASEKAGQIASEIEERSKK